MLLSQVLNKGFVTSSLSAVLYFAICFNPHPAPLIRDTFLCASLVGRFHLVSVTGCAHLLSKNCSPPALLDLIKKTLNQPFPACALIGLRIKTKLHSLSAFSPSLICLLAAQ